MGTRCVLTVEVYLFMDALSYDEDTSAYSLALEDIRLVFALCSCALLYVDELCFHPCILPLRASLGQERTQ